MRTTSFRLFIVPGNCAISMLQFATGLYPVMTRAIASPVCARLIIAVLSIAAFAGSASAVAADPTEQFFDELLAHQLVRVAENEALRRLDDPLLKPAERVQWTIRLARAYVQHSQLSQGRDREDLAKRGRMLLEDLATAKPPLPRREAVIAHQVLLGAELAELKRWEWEVTRPDDRLRQSAHVALRDSAEALRPLVDRLDEDARAAARRTPVQLADGELSGPEVRRLQQEVEFQLAAALVGLIETSPESSRSSTVIAEADRRLQALANGWAGEVRTWEARLLRARLARLRGEFGAAGGIIRSALQDQPARWLADRLTAEQVRTQLAAGQVDAALDTLLNYGKEQGSLSDELAYLQVETLLQARQLAESQGDARTSEQLWLRAEAWTQRLHGGWENRAIARLDREKESTRYGGEVAELLRSARSAFAAGEIEQAALHYELAADKAAANGQTLVADEFDYTRGSILLQAEQYAQAAAAFQRVLERGSLGPQTQDADLMRAYALGRCYAAEPTRARREAYVSALQEHRASYAGTPSAAEATWMLAVFEEGRHQWTEALPLYLELARSAKVIDPARTQEAQLRAAILYERVLDRLREINQPHEGWEDRAVEDLATFVRSFPETPGNWSLPQAETSLRLVRIVLAHRERPYAEADRLLAPILQVCELYRQQAHRAGTELDPEWQRLHQLGSQLRVVSLAGQGRVEEAKEVFDTLAVTDPQSLLGLLQGLSELAEQIPPDRRKALAHLQLEAAQRIRAERADLTEQQQRLLDESRADAYLAAGNVVDAIATLEALLSSAPYDLTRRRHLALLLQEHGSPSGLAKAKSYWKRIEKSQKPGTPAWFESRLQIARCAAQLGEATEAKKLIALTRIVYPELGTAELKAQFDRLERELAK